MKSIKFNWGFGIAATYILFLIGTFVMVAIFMNQDVSLETDNYYAKGIEYQQHIDKLKRTEELPEKLAIQIEVKNLLLSFPKNFKSQSIAGTIQFYRPSEEGKDFTISIQPDSSNLQVIDKNLLAKGLWKIKVDWVADNISYYNEKMLMVN